MEWYEIKVDGGKSVKFPENVFSSNTSILAQSINENRLGGLIKGGEWAWLAKDSTLQIVSLKHGNTVSIFEFTESKGYDNCVIKCVDQLFPRNTNGVYLAICLNSVKCPGGSLVAFYSVDQSIVLNCIELKVHVTCCRFVEFTVCRRSLLQHFDGCLALGSMDATVVLLDLRKEQILTRYELQNMDDVFTPCRVVNFNRPLREIHQNYKQCQQDGIHFCLKIEVVSVQSSVQCILPINLNLSLAIGLEDGCLVLYDLTELQSFYVATPDPQCREMPLVKLDFFEPSDDPRPCFYIWALHEGNESIRAVLHSFMYENRLKDHNGDNSSLLETFQTSCVRLTLSLESGKCQALSCQAITKFSVHGEEDSTSLCALSWHSESDKKNKLLIFDLNQWYKEEMPFAINEGGSPSYLAAYILSGQYSALESYINPTTIAYFNSIQRLEEHFYPNSLSFDCCLLMGNGCLSYIWEGAQNRFINILRSSNATIFLEPNAYFHEIIRTHLMPQFFELSQNATFSTHIKYEAILSVALEYNCFSLLRDCAKCWFDGSFIGNSSTLSGITISTLTDWIWNRATAIKTRCNDLCKCLFDFVGFPLDQREQKELGFISRQLKLLAELLGEVLTNTKRNLSGNEHNNLELKYKSVHMASKYQEILLWLLNIGLLPEASRNSSKVKSDVQLVPYPYRILKTMYAKKRVFLRESENIVSKKNGSCRLIYIDSFIEHECKSNVLREYWMENNGNGLYPPPSIESMLRIMLVSDMSYESKCAVLLYFFLDLNMVINNDAYKNVVANFIKFPSVFKLSASLIKTVQAFWNLDHGNFLPSVDEFLSPFNKNQNYPQWLIELMVETLLTQNASNLALRILEAHSSLISPVLKLQTLLSNDLISEAFHFARSKKDESLLEQFFKCCLCNGKFSVIRDLALSEKEGQLVQDILKCSKTENVENLHLVYLLQKSKYIEAVSYMDEISKSKCMSSYLNTTAMNTPNLVLSAYNTTMTPVTQGLTDVYFRIRNRIRKKETDNKSPVPLSCQLIKHNANQLLGGIYHSSALSAHFATYYWGEMDDNKKRSSEASVLLSSNNAPFLRKPQIGLNFLDFDEKNAISYPQAYKVPEKRTLAESDLQQVDGTDKLVALENPKKRRKILNDEVVKELSLFAKINKNALRLSNSDWNLTTTQDGSPVKESIIKMGNFLTQPPPLNSQQSEVLEKSTELHSILKTNTPEPPERVNTRREVALEDETKNIRFTLPCIEETMEEVEQNEDANKQTVLDNGQDHLLKNIDSEKIFVRSVSVESSSSTSCSSKALSEEHFYSPLSQNNSLLLERPSNLFEPVQRSSISLNFAEGPKARKPLARIPAESEPKRELTISKAVHCLKNHLPENPGEPLQNQNLQKPSRIVDFKRNSDFASSFKQNSTEKTTSSTTLISAVMSAASNIKDFEPQVSSSKVCETQSNFTMQEISTRERISEKSTVVDTTMYTELTIEPSKVFQCPIEINTSKGTKFPVQELDTTLGMSSYDLTILESTSLHETKSFLPQKTTSVVTAVESKMYSEERFMEESKKRSSIYADLETDLKVEAESESNVLFDVSMGLEENLHTESSNSSNFKENKSLPVNENEDDIIVLSSSEDEESIYDDSVYEESEFNRSECTCDDEDGESAEETCNLENGAEDDEDVYENEDYGEIADQLKEDTILNVKVVEEKEEVKGDEGYEHIDKAKVDTEKAKEATMQTVEIALEKEQIDDSVERQHACDPEKILIVEITEEKEKTENDAQCQHTCGEEAAKVVDEMEERIKSNVDVKVILDVSIEQKEINQADDGSKLMPFEHTEYHNIVKGNRDGYDVIREGGLEDPQDLLDNENACVTVGIEGSDDSNKSIVTKKVADGTERNILDTSEELLQVQCNKKLLSSNAPVQVKSERVAVVTDSNDKVKLLESEMAEALIHTKLVNVPSANVNLVHDSEIHNKGDFTSLKCKRYSLEGNKVKKEELANEVVNKVDIEIPAEKRLILPEAQVGKDFESSSTDQKFEVNKDKQRTKAEGKINTDLKILEKDRGTIYINKKIDSKNDVDRIEDHEKDTLRKEGEAVSHLPVTRRSLRADMSVGTSSIGANTPELRKQKAMRAVSTDLDITKKILIKTGRSRKNSDSFQLEPLVSHKTLTPSCGRGYSAARDTNLPSDNDYVKEDRRNTSHNVRAASVPPAGATPAKVTGRRCSVVLEAITENVSVLDSPSSRTRSRARLNSNGSELDTSLLSKELPVAKRTRKGSFSSNISEQPLSTPTKRTLRRNSVSSQPENGTPRTLRARSVASIQNECSTTPTKLAIKRRSSRAENPDDYAVIKKSTGKTSLDNQNQDEKSKSTEGAGTSKKHANTSPKGELNATSSYSSSRRLTRTQLAMMEKSVALADGSVHNSYDCSSPAPPAKRVIKRRTSNSTVTSQLDSDDAESIGSHKSSLSSATISRRVTRSSVKDKDEVEEDLVSIASSTGSGRYGKRRSNDSKESPGIQLSVIPEDEMDERSLEPKKRTRRTKQ